MYVAVASRKTRKTRRRVSTSRLPDRYRKSTQRSTSIFRRVVSTCVAEVSSLTLVVTGFSLSERMIAVAVRPATSFVCPKSDELWRESVRV